MSTCWPVAFFDLHLFVSCSSHSCFSFRWFFKAQAAAMTQMQLVLIDDLNVLQQTTRPLPRIALATLWNISPFVNDGTLFTSSCIFNLKLNQVLICIELKFRTKFEEVVVSSFATLLSVLANLIKHLLALNGARRSANYGHVLQHVSPNRFVHSFCEWIAKWFFKWKFPTCLKELCSDGNDLQFSRLGFRSVGAQFFKFPQNKVNLRHQINISRFIKLVAFI